MYLSLHCKAWDPPAALLLCPEIHPHIHPWRPPFPRAGNDLIFLNSHSDVGLIIILHLKTLKLKAITSFPQNHMPNKGQAFLSDLLGMYHVPRAKLGHTQRLFQILFTGKAMPTPGV